MTCATTTWWRTRWARWRRSTQHFGLPLTGAAADAIRSLAAASAPSAGGESGHRYALDEFGLTGEEVDERFAAYADPPGGKR